MNILFIHQNFPGQFIHLAAMLAADGRNRVKALCVQATTGLPQVEIRRYAMLRPAAPETHPLLREQESHILRAEACAAAAFKLKSEAFLPDIVIAHPGWGESLFIKNVFPQARLVLYCEYYYAEQGQDVGFDPEQPVLNFSSLCRLQLKNSTNLLSLDAADAAYSPTQWQRSTYPAWAREKIRVLHDGIDLERLKPDPNARLVVRSGITQQPISFTPGAELLSYVARNLEPVRGFHTFMRLLPEILARRPQAQVVVAGGDDVSYGSYPPGGGNWKTAMLAELEGQLDLNRIHFVGQIAAKDYLALLQVSRVHAYWTTPFVLSWSFLEAAISGLPVVASDTAPVREFASQLGVETVGFFDRQQYADRLAGALKRPAKLPRRQRDAAQFDIGKCTRDQHAWLLSL